MYSSCLTKSNFIQQLRVCQHLSETSPHTTAIECVAVLWSFDPIHRFKETFEGSLMLHCTRHTDVGYNLLLNLSKFQNHEFQMFKRSLKAVLSSDTGILSPTSTTSFFHSCLSTSNDGEGSTLQMNPSHSLNLDSTNVCTCMCMCVYV